MLSSGVSFPRVMKPYFVAATFLTALSLIVNHMVLPAANKVRLAFEEEHIRATFFVDAKNIHRELDTELPRVHGVVQCWPDNRVSLPVSPIGRTLSLRANSPRTELLTTVCKVYGMCMIMCFAI
ncbi:MAG: hypothetical protein IPI00_06430 [Flavobacteriales bacterium]|nr:hypothetical protein [Flavobacteriales bacterium]